MDHEQRLTNLETTVAFQDRTIHELNQVIVRQQTQLERVEVELRRLTEQQRPQVRDAADEELPPHY